MALGLLPLLPEGIGSLPLGLLPVLRFVPDGLIPLLLHRIGSLPLGSLLLKLLLLPLLLALLLQDPLVVVQDLEGFRHLVFGGQRNRMFGGFGPVEHLLEGLGLHERIDVPLHVLGVQRR